MVVCNTVLASAWLWLRLSNASRDDFRLGGLDERTREDRGRGVEQWAEVRRLQFVRGRSIREIHHRTGLHRDTIRNALSADEAPRYSRAPAGSKLDPFGARAAGLAHGLQTGRPS